MSGLMASAAKSANVPKNRSSFLRNEIPWIDDMLAVARRIWPRKTAQHLAAVTGVSERSAQFWLAGETGMTMAAARELIRSEHGYEFLAAYVGEDCKAAWFVRTQVAQQRAVTKRSIEEARRNLEKLDAQHRQLEMYL